ncbi:MAG: LytTR family DNA-binding domain-containing protein, partial [Bacteroidales bacterium]|nr:LytTR family DNA-binding domain-containing protein [Bacteroidales bacterium]
LKNYVLQMPQLELAATFNKAMDAYDFIQNNQVDILFLDIQMPGLTGLDFIRTLVHKPHIILTTAYSEYALEGFNLNVSDYLLKPISFERFAQAVLKVSKLPESSQINTPAHNLKDFLFLKSGYKSVKVMIKDITHVEGTKEYVTIYCGNGKKYLKHERMKNIEEELINHSFIRIHKSYLVNINHITSYYGNTLEIGENKLPIGRAYKEGLKEVLE